MEETPELTNSFVHGDALGLLFRMYEALPYLLRRVLGVPVLMALLLAKPLINAPRSFPTPREQLYTLSFWGVPRLDEEAYRLRVHGRVGRELVLSLPDLEARTDTDRVVTLDCVGGTRNVVRMRGVSLRQLLEAAEPEPEAETAVFRCADGYHEAAPVEELLARDAFLAHEVAGEALRRMGYPLRLAFPGKYGYKWAKWVTEVELVEGPRKGYWPTFGLPDRADVGDIF